MSGLNEEALQGASMEEIHAALFLQMVTGHAQMVLMFLGKTPHPETGELEQVNLEAAKHFIDQLEMLQAKTRGNVSPAEAKTLAQMLSAAQIAFVEALDAAAEAEAAPGETSAGAPAGEPTPPRFSKKYE